MVVAITDTIICLNDCIQSAIKPRRVGQALSFDETGGTHPDAAAAAADDDDDVMVRAVYRFFGPGLAQVYRVLLVGAYPFLQEV